jgi:DNA-binding MarR family transcriptional regulator
MAAATAPGNAMNFDHHTELQLMEALESEPETSQADLAAKVGVAVGTVNWYLKRWSAKGYVKVKRIGRWRWRYLLTPQGVSEKATLAAKYFDYSMTVYRRTRTEAKQLLAQVREAGFEEVVIEGDGDIADIYALTCLEYGLKVNGSSAGRLPVLKLGGTAATLIWPESEDAHAPSTMRPE